MDCLDPDTPAAREGTAPGASVPVAVTHASRRFIIAKTVTNVEMTNERGRIDRRISVEQFDRLAFDNGASWWHIILCGPHCVSSSARLLMTWS